MDFVTAKSTLRARIGNPTTTDVTDAILGTHINEAYEEIMDNYRFHRGRTRYSFVTVASTQEYTLSNNVLAVFRVYDYTNKKWITKTGSRSLTEYDQVNGKPTRYIREGDKILLLPIPDGVYTIYVFGKIAYTPLAANGDIPVLPLPWHQGILLLARYKYYDAIPDVAKAQYAFNAFQLWVQKKPSEIDEETRDIEGGVSIPGLAGSDDRLDFDHEDA